VAVEQGDIREVLKDPSAVVVYLAMECLRAGLDRPFEASISKIRELTGLSDPIISKKRAALVEARVFVETTVRGLPGRYVPLKCFAKLFLNTRKGPRRVLVSKAPPSVSTEELSKQIKEFKTTREERREAVGKALRLLGSPLSARRLVSQSMKELYGLVEHDGFTTKEALEVVKFCLAEYDRTKFRPMLNLPYVWSSKQFTSLLTAARLNRGLDDGETLAEQQHRRDGIARRLKEKGLMP